VLEGSRRRVVEASLRSTPWRGPRGAVGIHFHGASRARSAAVGSSRTVCASISALAERAEFVRDTSETVRFCSTFVRFARHHPS
jgi:hypothetical protein